MRDCKPLLRRTRGSMARKGAMPCVSIAHSPVRVIDDDYCYTSTSFNLKTGSAGVL